MSGDEDDGKEHLRKSKEHLEKGTEKFLRHGIRKGKEKKQDVQEYKEYYQDNREELIDDLTSSFFGTKEPAKVGIIVLLPVLVTLYVVDWVLGKLSIVPGTEYLNVTQYYLVNQSIKLGLLIFVSAVIVTGVGRFVRTGFGFRVEKALDYCMEKIPFLGSIYNITKVTADTVLSGADEFNKPVKVEMQGIRVTGFKTGNEAEDGRDVIFVPTAPNITSGFVIEPDPEKVEDAEESTEQALTRILSAGFGDSNGEDKKRNMEGNE